MRQGEEVTVATSDRTGRSTDVAVMLRVNGSRDSCSWIAG
jgi:hypothetical protein